jgi:hypothetical protein
MGMLFEKPGEWTCEHTAQGIFFVRMLMPLSSPAQLDSFMDEARPHLERLQPVLYMNDATHVQGGPLTLQWRLASHMRSNAKYIKRSAVFGLTPPRAFLVRSIVRAAGRTNVKVYDTREECERWLLESERESVSADEKRSASREAS